jgi:Carboxypeptidase regulatory-like domain
MRVRVLGIAILACLIAAPAFAQQGQINGVVSDSSGGVIPGATITATETATGFVQTTVSGANGRYSFPSLRPTGYTISAELAGFRTFRRTDIVLAANQSLTLSITLELGELSETVTVAGETSQVDITTATIAEVVDHARIVELPIAGREVARLQTLVAGTVVGEISSETGKSLPGAVKISANGAGDEQNSYRLDGISNTDSYFQENQSFPFPDALQEFSIQTSNYSASYGNNAGAVVNVVTRSGTNTFHGGAFEYLRDRQFNSKGYFAAEKDFLKRNQHGGFVGGPLRRNSTFFFAGYQRTRITNREAELIGFVPTPAQARGDFSSCVPACPQLYNPATGLPFPNNQIPVAMFDPASAKVLAILPTSNSPDGRVTIPRGTGQRFNQFVLKVDQQLGGTNQISVRYFIDDFNNESQFVPGNVLSYRGPSLESNPRSQSIATTWKKTLSPTLLNESTFGYNRLFTARQPHSDVPAIQDFGVRLPYLPRMRSISSISASGYFSIGDNLEARFPRDGFQFNNRTNWIKGRHSIQFGGEIEYLRPEIYNDYRRAGHFSFDGRFTRAPGAASGGHALADFLLGRLNSFDHGTGEYKNYRNLYQSLFFQDDMKLTSRVTVNLGARYEPSRPWHDLVGRFQYFTLEGYQQNIRSPQYPDAPPGLLYRGDPGVPEDGTRPDMNNVSGRFGIAWDVTGDGKTSIRGGGGMFYDTHLAGDYNNGGVNAPPWSIRVAVTEPPGPFSDPYRGRTDFAALQHDYEDKDTIIGASNAPFPRPVLVESFDEVFDTPLTYNYNLAFEREVAAGWMARAAYVGSRATNGRSNITLNPAIYTPGGPTGNPDARRVMKEYGSLNQYVQDRSSRYNSMQLTLNRRYADGFTVRASYTLADLQGTIGGPEVAPYFHPELDQLIDQYRYGRLDNMRRHRFVASWVYELPGPQSGVLGNVVGGWQVTGIFQAQSGEPLTIGSGRDNAGWGLGNDSNRAIRTGQPFEAPAGSPETVWFNAAAFAVNPNGTFGETRRGEYFGPGDKTVDLGLFKNFRISGDMNVQFRAEFFNAFNTVNWGNPGTNVSSPASFGRITSADDPRIMQFGLKFVF